MGKTKSKALSFLLILSLFVGMVGIINTDAVYAASKKKIHVKKTSVSLDVGKTYQQKLIDKKGKTIKAKKVKWKSKNVRVAKINKKGKITAVNTGTAKMTAKYKGKTYKFTIKVTPAAPATANNNSSNSYSANDLNSLRLYISAAAEYANAAYSDGGKWASANYFQHSDTYKTHLANLYSDLDSAKEWLEKAQQITGNNTEMNCKTADARNAGYSTWDNMISSLMIDCIKLRNTDTSSYTYYSDAGDFMNNLNKFNKMMQVALTEVQAN